jgi:hypothetical protein
MTNGSPIPAADRTPRPPSDLAARELPLRVFDPGTVFWRIHDARRAPVWFGPAPGAPAVHRFDAELGVFRVCYVALTPEAAFAESFLRNPGRRMLDRTLIAGRAISQLTFDRRIQVIQFHGPGLARVGATAEVSHGPAYALSRQWSHALWSHPSRPDGILYTSRHDDDEHCIALFDRAPEGLHLVSSESLLDTPLLAGLLRRYKVSLDPSS